ncbi:hypothetical protein O9G_006173 [Rozella allomycis CSF55]|uniref:Uncharacterized protein n=1 Tax=Rozella allomycis (strain CSF55) TaxID=988480 RepID=A0A075B2Q8_ROZAC|nr:hypothetical protein O9G_006173 [Rozella allomycis CSF55]|eukprot:EPZ36604.1 hypothetical protein O9G_006173 [Rozella allomycis CSF55]
MNLVSLTFLSVFLIELYAFMLSEKLLALALIFAKRSIPDRYSIYSDLLPGRISRTNLREEISTTEFKQIAGTSLIPLLHNSVVKKGNEYSVYSDVAKIKYVQDSPSGKLRLKKIYKYLPDSEGPILKQTKELMLADLTSYLKMLKLDKYISISHLRFLPKEVFKFDQQTETMVATHMSSTVYMTANFNLPFFRISA